VHGPCCVRAACFMSERREIGSQERATNKEKTRPNDDKGMNADEAVAEEFGFQAVEDDFKIERRSRVKVGLQVFGVQVRAPPVAAAVTDTTQPSRRR
jgi:hypothetical protein